MTQLNPGDLEWIALPPATDMFERLATGLRPAVRSLARELTTSQTKRAIATLLRCHDQRTFSAQEIALQVGRLPAAVNPALADWVGEGLLMREMEGKNPVYRLTADPQRRRDLEDAVTWQDFWLAQAWSIARAAGGCLLRPQTPDSAVLPAATVRHCLPS
jgi:hypothetical protein